jgi:transcriptional regulator with XRE-family HTH domain
MDTSEDTLRKWEDGRTPIVTAYPRIFEFLGCEPWDDPTTLAGQIRAARYRRGLRIKDAAKLLSVDPSTLWWWEAGRTPHRIADRAAIADFVRDRIDGQHEQADGPSPDQAAEPSFDLGESLRSRRTELGLTIAAAAQLIKVNTWTLLHWEHNRRMPACRFFPSIIRFLGREPWPGPQTIAERLRAERLRRGLSCSQVAGLIQVDDGSVNAWEAGNGPHHALAKAKVEGFVTGNVRLFRRNRPKAQVGTKRRKA